MSPSKNKATASKQDVSKEEMDELAQALSASEAGADSAAGQIRAYDFARPERLSKLNLRALDLVFADTSRLWTSRLSSALGFEAAVEMRPIEQTHFAAYAETSLEPRILFTMSMDPLKGTAIIDLPATLALRVVDRIMGGKGELFGQPRLLTKMESNVMKRLVDKLAVDLAAAWSPITSARFEALESHGSVAEMEVDGSAPILIAASVWTVDSAQYDINLIAPIDSLRAVLDLLDPQVWQKANAASAEVSPESVADLLEPVNVALTVQLGRTTLNVKEAVNLEVGDVALLDTHAHDTLVCSVGGKPAFYVKPGLVRNRLSVQIVGRINDTSQMRQQPGELPQTQHILGAA